MKKFIIAITLLIVIFFPFQSFAANESLNNFVYIVVNDQLVSFHDTYPVIRKGTTYVPISALAEYLNVHTRWDKSSHCVFLTKKDQQIVLDLSLKALFTDKGQIITDCIFLENDHTMAPYKFIANYFGYEVSYIDEGPIARAKDNTLSVGDDELFFMLQNKILKEKERILGEIQKKKEAEAERKRLLLRKKGKIVYITFDDGPSIYTEKIIHILDQYHAKATFFMLSNRIRTYKNIVRKLINEGHAVGLHGVSHNVRKIYRSPNTVVSEMNSCNTSLQQVTGTKTNLIRVPYGSAPYMTKPYRKAVQSAGYKMWDWNVDSRDSLGKNISPNVIIRNVKKQVKKQKIPVILLHERSTTVKALPQILKYLKENGYNPVSINKNQQPINFWNRKY
ncbi:polysaccharide deacetylase family protein [Crassaminicella profunda]|uniref:polysaccharide deacetylase family protein n=1 Tax=Crassaminicella profunda TaxID=1286698 RepID=UPI001CA7AC8F|nr:polysaccharide deacetylase family protein [Crassaminicella profunda]QZY54562.1 polysaccharide deacetylase family protein [Crassaminicella profunda]